MNKIERDGMIGVVISARYGSGWSIRYPEHRETLCMDAEIVQAVIDGDKEKAIVIAKQKCGEDFYKGSAAGLTIEWIPKGQAFKITEFDGYESVEYIDEPDCLLIA